MTIGNRIQEARKRVGLTQEELGERIGVTGVAIMRYEKDKRQPRIEQLMAIAAALGVPVQQLIPETTSAAFDFQDAALDELRAKLPDGYGIAAGNDVESPLQIIYPDGKLSKEVSQGDLWAAVQNAAGYLCYVLDKFR